MKKPTSRTSDELRPEYDLTKLKNRVRGKYAAAYGEGTNLVLPDPDTAAAFPTSTAVNKALRSLLGSKPTDTQVKMSK